MDRLANGWGCGPIVSDFAGIQGAFFRLLGKQDRTPGDYPRDPGDGADGATNEYFHPLVRIREERVRSWDPVPMRGWNSQPPSEDRGWVWVKEGVQSLPEYVMRPEKVMSLAYDDAGVTKFKNGQSLSRMLCPMDILMQIDRENGLSANGEKNKASL